MLNSPIALSTLTWGIDCKGSEVALLGGLEIPAIWPYVTGTPDVRWTELQISHFVANGSRVYRVNQAYDSPSPFDGDEFDVEALAWTPRQFCDVVAERRTHDWSTRGYCTWSTYGAIKQELADRGIGRSVWFRIADWNLDQHLADLELHADVYSGQWASPTTNPATMIPGTKLTLGEANADLNVLLLEYTGWQG